MQLINKPVEITGTFKLSHILLIAVLMLISCSSLIYKIKRQEKVVETITIDTVFVSQWVNHQDKTAKVITPKQEKQIVNNLTKLLFKKEKGEKLSEWDLFRLEVWKISGEIKEEMVLPNASRFQIYDWTMKLFWHESGFDGKAKNKKTSAKGLFQVMPFVAREMKIPNLTKMPEIKQLPYYKKYILYWLKIQKDISKINSAGDWYMLGLYPAHAGSSDDFVFAVKNGRGKKRLNYTQNSGLDLDRNGIITKGEIEQKLLNHFQ